MVIYAKEFAIVMFQLFLSQKLMSHILKCHYFAEIGKSLKKLLFKSFFLINSRVLGNKMLRFLFKMQILFVKNLSKGESLWEMYLEKRFSCLKEAVFRNCGLKYEYIYIYIYIFYQGFLSRTLTTHRTAQEGKGPSFIPCYHFHPLTNIYLQLCKWHDYHVFLIAPFVFTRLLFDEIYYLIELPFDWLMMWR